VKFLNLILLFIPLSIFAQFGDEWKPLPKVKSTPAYITKVKADITVTPKKDLSRKLKEELLDTKFTFQKIVKPKTIDSNFTFNSFHLKHNNKIEVDRKFFFKDNSTSNIKYLDRVHGLFTSGITSICEDQNGLIYLGSSDGLAIYNGDEFYIYEEIGGFSLKSINSIFFDEQQRIWVSTENGIAYIKNNQIFIPNSDYINSWNGVTKGKDGGVIIYTRYLGLFSLNKNILTCITPSLVDKSVSRALLDDNKIWLSYRLREKLQKTGYIRNDSLFTFDSEQVVYFFNDQKQIWLSFFSGDFYRFRNDSLFDVTNSLSIENKFRSFSIKENNNGIWIAVYGGGVLHINKKGEINSIEPREGLASEDSYSLLIDRENNIWVTDLGNGLSRIEDNILSINKEREPIQKVSKIVENINGDIIYFKNGNLLTKETENEIIRYSNPSINKIATSFHSLDGFMYNDEIWTSNYEAGLTLIRDNEYTFYQYGDEIPYKNSVFNIQRDATGKIWMNTLDNNLLCFQNDSYLNYSLTKEFKDFEFFTVSKTFSKKIIALIIDNGFLIIDGGKYIHHKKKGKYNVSCVYEDSLKNLWIAEKNQIQIINKNGKSIFLKDELLVENNVNEITQINKSEYLLATNNGIIRLLYDGDSYNFELFDESYGQQLLGVSSIVQDKNNKILAASRGKLYNLNLSFLNQPVAPILTLNTIFIDDSLAVQPFVLDQKSTIEFQLNKILWANESVLKYRIIKNNLKAEWTSEKSNKIRLNELSYGNYQLEVFAVSEDNRSKQLTYSFEVLPYWYQTWWAYALLIFITITIVFIYIQFKIKQAQKKQVYLEKLVSQKTKELKTEKEEVGKQLSQKELLLQEVNHRVKNNMQMVSSLLELQSANINDEKSKQYLKESVERIRSLGFAHQDLYQNEDYNHINIEKYLLKIISNLCSNPRFNSNIELPDDYLMHIEKAQALGFIVNELATNSIKYAWTRKESSMNISLVFKIIDNKVIFTYSDNGRGFKKGYDLAQNKSLGSILIKSFVSRQLNGKIETYNKDGAHTIITYNQDYVS